MGDAVCVTVGETLENLLGTAVEFSVGVSVMFVGRTDGGSVGPPDGAPVDDATGLSVDTTGCRVGDPVGKGGIGADLGLSVTSLIGSNVGTEVVVTTAAVGISFTVPASFSPTSKPPTVKPPPSKSRGEGT